MFQAETLSTTGTSAQRPHSQRTQEGTADQERIVQEPSRLH